MRIKLNLMPWRQQQREKTKKNFIIGLIFSGFVIITLCLYLNYYFSKRIQLQLKHKKNLQEKIIKLDKKIVQVNVLKQQKKQLMEKFLLINSIKNQRFLIVHLFDELSQLMPDNTFLTRLNDKNNRINLEGFSGSNEAISLLLERIKANPWMKNSNLIEIKKLKNSEKKRFVLRFTIVNKSNKWQN